MQNEKAFTFIEALIVMVIIGIMATIAIPRMDLIFGKNKLRKSTTSVTATLYIARMKAVNDGQDYGVQFQGSGDFQIVRDPYGTLELAGAPYRLDQGITFREITFVDSLAVFNSFGQLEKSCLPSGELTGSIILSDDIGDSTKVEVTFITGRIRETSK